ncbi:Hypothetical protein LUCI_2369 [Lucifera butyrica]|uniref:Porin domain-containing protein n=1 Tax=Lucifera butyrica TaxID=1351585 RepID=A0A498R820_9FIRM|nr:hypothetical protein [Lucifera butyrica]VBB07125.1 Hypothetical protein LUCI_2369 [Lucifera butyrica]
MLRKYQINRSILALAICFALFSETAAASGEISLEGEYWNPHVSGELKSSVNIDVKNDLGLGHSSIADLKLGFKGDKGPKYFIKYENPSFNNTGSLTHSLNFDGRDYSAGDRVTSSMDVKHYQFGIQNDKITPGGKISIIYSYNHNSIHTGIQDVTQNFDRNKDGTSDALNVGFAWESLNRKGINFFAAVTPLSIGTHGGYLDYNAGVKSEIGKTMTLTAGYRGERLEAGKTSGSDGSTINLKGWYVFLGSGF